MKEDDLKRYWNNELSIEQLNDRLRNCRVDKPVQGTNILIEMTDSTESAFEVTRDHLIDIVKQVITRNLQEIDLNSIAYTLILSEHYIWDGDSEDGEIVATCLFDWDSPEENFPLSRGNIKRWQTYLHTGEYSLSNTEQ